MIGENMLLLEINGFHTRHRMLEYWVLKHNTPHNMIIGEITFFISTDFR